MSYLKCAFVSLPCCLPRPLGACLGRSIGATSRGGENDDVVLVPTDRAVVFPAAGEEHQPGGTAAAVDPVCWEVVEGKALNAAHCELHGDAVPPSHHDLVTALQGGQAVEHRRPGLGVNVPHDDRVASGTRQRPILPPANVAIVTWGSQAAVAEHTKRDGATIDGQEGNADTRRTKVLLRATVRLSRGRSCHPAIPPGLVSSAGGPRCR